MLDKAAAYADAGDLRFAAELLKHAVFADPDDAAAKDALADVYEQLGYGAENGTWRNFYLTGAQELRDGVKPPAVTDLGAGMAGALTIEQLFDSLAIRVDGPRAAAESLVIDWHFTDIGTDAAARAVQRRADPDREPADSGRPPTSPSR